jgi:hypothetical protein
MNIAATAAMPNLAQIFVANIAARITPAATNTTSTTTSNTANTSTTTATTTTESPLEKLADFISGLSEDQQETFYTNIVNADDNSKNNFDASLLDVGINEFDKEFYSSIKKFCKERGALLEVITEHGSIVNAYTNLPDQLRAALLKGLTGIATRENGAVDGNYEKELNTFKESMAAAITTYNNCLKYSAPVLQKQAQENLFNDLGQILENANGQFRKEDLEALTKALAETATKTDKDPEAKHSLSDLTAKFFSKEGLMIAAMAIPTLGQLMSGTLGQLPIIGGLFKQISGLVSGLGSLSQQFIPIYTMFQQQETKRAVADISVAQKEKPPAKVEEANLAQAA